MPKEGHPKIRIPVEDHGAVNEWKRTGRRIPYPEEVSTETHKSSRFNVVTLPDWHVPFHDDRAIRAAFAFCKGLQPDIIIVHEAHDFYDLSKFDKDPARRETLQDEIDEVNRLMRRLRRLCPDSQIILLESNHLDRLRRYLWSTARPLSSLRSLRLENLLQLDDLDIQLKPHYMARDIVLHKHGDIVSAESGYTARRELMREGCSGISGHTHRLGSHYRTVRGGEYVWVEAGCLCDLNPEYVSGVANWQHGIGLVSFTGTGQHFFAAPIPIIDGKVMLGG